MSQQDTISVRNWIIGIYTGAGIAILFVILILLFNKLGTIETDEPKELRYERIKPVSQVNVGQIITITPIIEKVSEPKSGEEVYEAVCKACHMLGVAGAPKFADKAGWTDRIAKGEETLIDHALNGFNTMPARGGNAELSDEEIKRAVQYMLAAVGADSAAEKEATPATPATAETVTSEASTPVEEEATTSEPGADVTSSESSSSEVTEETGTAPATPEAAESVTPDSTPVEEEPVTNEADAAVSSSEPSEATPSEEAPSSEEPTTPEPSDDSAALSTESIKVTSSEEASKKKTWAELAAESVVSSSKVAELVTAEVTSKKKTASEPPAEERLAATETEIPASTQETAGVEAEETIIDESNTLTVSSEEKAAAEITSTEVALTKAVVETKTVVATSSGDQAVADPKGSNGTTETTKSVSTTEAVGTDPKTKTDEASSSEPLPTAAAVPTNKPVVATQAEEPVTQLDLTPFDLARGEQIYNTICTMCHNTGLVGAPKLGDKESWVPRMAQGLDILFVHSLKGFKGQTGVMPPKGGQIQVPDEDIEAAVAYMVSKVQ